MEGEGEVRMQEGDYVAYLHKTRLCLTVLDWCADRVLEEIIRHDIGRLLAADEMLADSGYERVEDWKETDGLYWVADCRRREAPGDG